MIIDIQSQIFYCQGQDNLGLGGDDGSVATGNAGHHYTSFFDDDDDDGDDDDDDGDADDDDED